MKRLLSFIVLGGVALTLAQTTMAQDNLVNNLKKNKSDKSVQLFKFKEVINLEHTPVETQGNSGTCWSYSTNSFLESEMARAGRVPVPLSPIFTARNAYIGFAQKMREWIIAYI